MSTSPDTSSTEKMVVEHIDYVKEPIYYDNAVPANHTLNTQHEILAVVEDGKIVTDGTAHDSTAELEPITPDLIDGNFWTRFRKKYNEYLGEFFGTMIMVLLVDGTVAQWIVSDFKLSEWTTIVIGAAGAVVMGWNIAVNCGSGGHINPAVIISFAVFRGFPWRKVPGYIFCQLFGGYMSAFILYAVYYQGIHAMDPHLTISGPTATSGIFATNPQPYLNGKGSFLDEFVGCSVLIIGLLALIDLNSPTYFPVGLFLVIVVLGSALGSQTGYALNIARDFGPRMALATIGYSKELFSIHHHYAFIQMGASISGVLFGTFLYDVFVYTGVDSPVNQAYFGFEWLFDRKSYDRKRNTQKELDVLQYSPA